MSKISVPQQVLDWLFKVLQPTYTDPRTTFHDVVQVLSIYKELRPRTRVFTFPDGTSTLLLSLYGKFEDVPVLFWIPKEYPLTAPYIYLDFDLIPENLMLEVNQSIDLNGRFYLPILAHWNPKSCSLLGAVEELLQTLKKFLPLRNKSAFISPPLPPKVYQKAPEAPNKLATEQLQQVKTSKENVSLSTNHDAFNLKEIKTAISHPPPLPLKPHTSGKPRAPPTDDATYNIANNNNNNGSITSEASYLKLSENTGIEPENGIKNIAARSRNTQYIQRKSEEITTQTSLGSSSKKSLPPDLMDEFVDISPNSTHNEMLLQMQQLVNKLAAQDKLYIQKFTQSQNFNADSLKSKFSSLISYENDLIEDLKRTKEEKLTMIKQEIECIDEELHKAQLFDKEIDPASIAVPETLAFVQLYNLVAKDHALTDAINVVSQLLHRSKISETAMVKKTRELSLEQFKTRFLISKITDMLD